MQVFVVGRYKYLLCVAIQRAVQIALVSDSNGCSLHPIGDPRQNFFRLRKWKDVPIWAILANVVYMWNSGNSSGTCIGKLRQNFFPLARAEKRGEKAKKGEKVEIKFSSRIALARFHPLNPTVPDHSSVRCGMLSEGISTTSVTR
jgi:hypothetical protein